MILAILSIFGGLFGVPHILHFLPNGMEWYFEGFYAQAPTGHGSASMEAFLMVASVIVALLPLWFAWKLYAGKLDQVSMWKEKYAFLYNVSFNKFFVDEAYDILFIQSIKKLSTVVFWRWFDLGVIDRLVHLSGDFARASGGMIRTLQNGILQQYALIFALGAIIILWYLIFLPL